MLRRAVIQQLRAQAPSLGGRVYQAFLAPVDAGRPYATVKIPASSGSPFITYAGTQPVEVRVYADPASFVALDQVEAEIIAALHGVDVVDGIDGERYEIAWVPGGGDFRQDEPDLIGRLVMFNAALLQERS